jgi:hypothetical protein
VRHEGQKVEKFDPSGLSCVIKMGIKGGPMSDSVQHWGNYIPGQSVIRLVCSPNKRNTVGWNAVCRSKIVRDLIIWALPYVTLCVCVCVCVYVCMCVCVCVRALQGLGT